MKTYSITFTFSSGWKADFTVEAANAEKAVKEAEKKAKEARFKKQHGEILSTSIRIVK